MKIYGFQTHNLKTSLLIYFTDLNVNLYNDRLIVSLVPKRKTVSIKFGSTQNKIFSYSLHVPFRYFGHNLCADN